MTADASEGMRVVKTKDSYQLDDECISRDIVAANRVTAEYADVLEGHDKFIDSYSIQIDDSFRTVDARERPDKLDQLVGNGVIEPVTESVIRKISM